MTATPEQVLNILEDTAELLKKTQVNLRKCPKQRLTRGYIQSRMQCIEDYWKTFNNAHQELAKLTPRDKRNVVSYFVNEEFFIYEDLYLCMLGELRDMLERLNTKPETANTEAVLEDSQQTQVNLPRITIPTFTGIYEEWPTFKDLYVSLVHDNKSLSQVQKLHYLKTSVSGEAATLLKHVQVTESNYLQAWETLKSRYGNKRLIVNSLLKRWFTQRKSTTQSASQLKSVLDTTNEVLNNLQNLDVSTDSWDPVIIFLVVQKLDPESHKDWEEFSYKGNPEELPSWQDLKTFLEGKFRTLELVTPSSSTSSREKTKERALHVSTTTETTCALCKENHTMSHCKAFAKLQPTERTEYVKTNKLCFNCLASGHGVFKCRVPLSCRMCKRRHHTLLHQQKKTDTVGSPGTTQPTVSTQAGVEEPVQVNTMMASYYNAKQDMGLLATAMVTVQSEKGHAIVLKALIDPGSQACFISEKAAQALKLNRRFTNKIVTGMEAMKIVVKQEVQVEVQSRWDSNFSLPIQAYVMSKRLTIQIPTTTWSPKKWPHLTDLDLADPECCVSGNVDLLLDVKGYAKILQEGLHKGPPGSPIAQRTNLGWIVFGEISIKTNPNEKCFMAINEDVDVKDLLKTMWEIDTDTKRKFTKEEQLCEEIYEKTHTRNKEGRYVVKLPFKTDKLKSPEGNTREIALNRFLQLERRLDKNPEMKEEYTKVIEDYKKLKHIEEVPHNDLHTKKSVYLPHHAVVRNDKETTKTRVVFDASCKGCNGVSLNDELLSGPVLQDDLRSLIIRWRTHAICYVSDIQKMYRMILVAKEDIDFQRILWRNSASENVQDFRLLTVTFGTTSAPYLAVKTLMQLADDEGAQYPEAARVLREDLYMDDVMSGADTLEEAIKISRDLKNVLHRGGFELKKWSSNNLEFMKTIEPSERSMNARLNINIDGTVKALGVQWNLGTDEFEYNLNLSPLAVTVTKRNILSDLQKLFDPLGWIAPSIVQAKILIQKLWQTKLDWDEEIDSVLKEEWTTIRADLYNINEIRIERWLGTLRARNDCIQIHGFCDASMKAYAAVVYCRVHDPAGNITTTIIAARTRVAPLKTVSLPRLELCGALLLSRLLKQISTAMRISKSHIFAWTDSTIVIAWIKGEPSRWKAFVANRAVEITDNVPENQWYHVQSHENPADLASRGALVTELKTCNLWWKGPEWLSSENSNYTAPEVIPTDLEQKTTIQALTIRETEEQYKSLSKQFEQFNLLIELVRSLTLCRRFLKQNILKEGIDGTITTEELQSSLHICIKLVQAEEFTEEIESLKRGKQVKRASVLKTLDPYLDQEQILRVGGRLRHSNLTEECKHPIILGIKNNLTPLIIADAHLKTLHGGMQLMLCYLRSKYWIIRAKSSVKKYVHRCLVCAKHNAAVKTQVMGDLPKSRVTPARPFLHSGVDFAGPLQILQSKGRGARTHKVYISVFICMATKAIHLELVGDLTSAAFIGAFKRFCARRGKCAHLWSDQGRNFVGANKELVALWKEACLEFSGEIADSLTSDGTQWHFIPPYSPNFGGLWEAGVKSVKFHLKRILNRNLTFEEMTTVLCEIEACLNSRPLCPRDDLDNENIEPLTPGHFLIGESPIAVPSPNLLNVNMQHLSRWQYTRKLLNDFWVRWQQEYLCRLQQRPKWLKREKDFEVGNIVLIKQENLPPGKWLLGRIIDKHPGPDGCTRVYSVKSGDSVVKRTVTKLCPLPINTNCD